VLVLSSSQFDPKGNLREVGCWPRLRWRISFSNGQRGHSTTKQRQLLPPCLTSSLLADYYFCRYQTASLLLVAMFYSTSR
jgi:hypothetical protein